MKNAVDHYPVKFFGEWLVKDLGVLFDSLNAYKDVPVEPAARGVWIVKGYDIRQRIMAQVIKIDLVKIFVCAENEGDGVNTRSVIFANVLNPGRGFAWFGKLKCSAFAIELDFGH